MARTKIKELPTLKNWGDVDIALREIAEKELVLVEIEGDMNKQIQGIKMSSALESKPITERIDTLGKDIKTYVTEHRAELDGKTRVLNFGKTGFRLSTKVSLPTAKDKIASIIKNLRARGMRDCIITTETINKDVLKKYTEDDIVKIGGTLKKEDVFWYETDREKLHHIQI